MRKCLQAVASSMDPSHCIVLLCGSAPYTRDIDLIAGLTQGERRLGRIYASDGAAQRHNDHLAPSWRIIHCSGNRCDCRPVEFPKDEVSLEMRHGRQKKSSRCLSLKIGHHPNAVVVRLESAQRPDELISRPWISAITDIDFEPWPLF